MKFKTPCFVRVENLEEREELSKFLSDIGRTAMGSAEQPYMVASDDSVIWCALEGRSIDTMVAQGYIDCGTNVSLFKALAAMNNENDREQWFTDGMDWRLCHDIIVTKMAIPSYALYHKATAEEIIEHFKNR